MASDAAVATAEDGWDGTTLPSLPRLTMADATSNIATIAYRNLVKFYRNRQLLLLSVVQPLTNMMLFAYVFNGVAHIPGISYREYVIPGVLIQAVMVTAMRTGVTVSYDSDSGMNDRFRSLPIARSAVLVGRTVSDTSRVAVQTVVLTMVACAAVGYTFHGGVMRAVPFVAVITVFGLAVTSFSVWVGLVATDPESAQTLLITPTLPLVFGSSGFAPVDRLPGWLRLFAEINPVSSAVDLSRAIAVGGPLLVPLIHFLLWTGGITATFTLMAVRRYQRG
jgi:ABC-2 type transport system permease protein/oleandomycin transport system permease protein